MNELTLIKLAKQAALMSPLLSDYPSPSNPKVTFPPSPYYRFLYLLAKETKASLAVELGVCGGGGSLHMAMASKRAIGVDIAWDHEDNIAWIAKNYHNYTFRLGDSMQLAEHIFSSYGSIDLLFIDTTHTYEQTMAEVQAYQPYMSKSHYVCLDDLFRPGMDRAWKEISGNKLRFDFLHPSQSPTDGGFGVIWK